MFSSWAVSEHLNVRERIIEVLALLVLKITLVFVPCSAFQVQTMDPNAFHGLRNILAFDLGIFSDYCVAGLGDFSTLFYCVEGPVIGSMGTGDLLTHTG